MCCYGNFRENQPTILLNINSAQPHKSAGATTVWNKVQQTQKYLYFFVNMKHARKNILNPDFIQNTRNKQRFRYYIIFHVNNNNVFTLLSDIDNYFFYSGQVCQNPFSRHFFIKNTLFGTRKTIIKKPENSGK